MPVAFPFPTEVEQAMKAMFRSLWEDDRRRYAAIEVAKLPHGGLDYIAGLLGCDPKTIRRGQQDLEDLQARPLQDIVPSQRVRKKGAGASPSSRRCPN